MPDEDANTSNDATLASHSPDTQLTVMPPFSLTSMKLALKNPVWSAMTEKQYQAMLKDPSQEGSVNVAFMRVETELRKNRWQAVEDPDFRAKQQTMLEEANGDPNIQINLILAGGMRGYTRCSQEEFDAKKRKARKPWIRDVERLQNTLRKLNIEVEPSRDQESASEASLQDTADGDSVLGSNTPKATDAYPNSAQYIDGSNTIRAPSRRAINSATAASAVSATCEFYPKQ